MMTIGKKYINFITGIIALSGLLFLVLPFINHVIIPKSSKIIKDRALDTTSLIYSDSDEALEANFFHLKTKK